MIVSFIIPAYNAADTIVRCLESIRDLTLKKEDYEIIVIDDASTDNTVAVIEDWRLKNEDCSLIILRQPENHRQGAARNRGVKEAKGEYICFVDADDAVTEGIVIALRSAAENKTDMTACHYAFVNEHGDTTKDADTLRFEKGQLFSGIEMQNNHPYWSSAPWGYIYKRAFLERVNYPFEEDVLFEDSDFVAVHLYHAKLITYTPSLGYKAYYREGSTTRSIGYKNIADYLLLGVRMLRFYERIKVESGKRKVEGAEQFAEGILEGACYNVALSCKRIFKLPNLNEVRLFYERLDKHINRKTLSCKREVRKYYWNIWTNICVGHKQCAIVCYAFAKPIYRLYKCIR